MAIQLQRQAAPLRMQVAAAIQEQIVTGVYQPGDRLVERRLEEDFQVSRTVIREALRQLESNQLITVKPNVGPAVTSLSMADARNLYQVRSALEGLAASLAADHATAQQVEELRGLLTKYEQAAEQDVTEILPIKDQFYDVLIQAARNPVIADLFANVQARIALLRAHTLKVQDRALQSHKELVEVVDAIAAGDGKLAGQLSRDHVAAAEEAALTHFTEVNDPSR